MSRLFLFVLFASFVSFTAFAQGGTDTSTTTRPQPQNPKTSPKTNPMADLSTWDRLYVGGSIGAGFSNDVSFIDVSPMVGYLLTERWSAGPGYTYQFIRYKALAESIHITGPRVFTRFGVLDWLFLHAEYEHLFFKWRSDVTGDIVKINSPGFYAGPGLRSGFDERSGGFLVVMYNFLETSYTPHSRKNPIIQMGFTIGL